MRMLVPLLCLVLPACGQTMADDDSTDASIDADVGGTNAPTVEVIGEFMSGDTAFGDVPAGTLGGHFGGEAGGSAGQARNSGRPDSLRAKVLTQAPHLAGAARLGCDSPAAAHIDAG